MKIVVNYVFVYMRLMEKVDEETNKTIDELIPCTHIE